MNCRAVRGAVVGQHPLDGDCRAGRRTGPLARGTRPRLAPCALTELRPRPGGCSHRSRCARIPSRRSGGRRRRRLCGEDGLPVGHADDAGSGASLDPAEFLDVDVDQLTRTSSLVALGWLQPDASELAHPDPSEDPRHGRDRPAEHFGDLWAGEPQPPQRRDRLDPSLGRAARDRPGRRRSVQQPELTIRAIPAHPLASAADADVGGLGPRPSPSITPRALDGTAAADPSG